MMGIIAQFARRANHDVHIKYVTILLHYSEVSDTSVKLNKINNIKRDRNKILNLIM